MLRQAVRLGVWTGLVALAAGAMISSSADALTQQQYQQQLQQQQQQQQQNQQQYQQQQNQQNQQNRRNQQKRARRAATRAAANAANQAALDAANKALEAAEATLDQVVDKLHSASQASPDWIAALKALNDAQAANLATRADVLAKMSNDPAYDKALSDKAAAVTNRATADFSTMEDTEAASKRLELAQAVLDATATVTKLENAVLAIDPAAIAAQAKVTAAAQAIAALNTQIEQSMKSNPDWIAAKKTVDDAQAKLDALMKKP